MVIELHDNSKCKTNGTTETSPNHNNRVLDGHSISHVLQNGVQQHHSDCSSYLEGK